MSFHIAEVMSGTIGVDSGWDPSNSTSEMESDTFSEYTVSIGLHLEKSKPAIIVEGEESYIFSWVDSFLNKEGFGSGYFINLNSECVLCRTTPSDAEIKDTPKGLMFYNSEVSSDTLERKSNSLSVEVDSFSEDTRIWTVNPPRLRIEDTISQCICESCEQEIFNSVKSLTTDGIPPKLLVYLL